MTGSAFPQDQAWLWYDDDPRLSLEEKINRAAKHYRKEKGVTVNLCYVSAGTIGTAPVKHVGGVVVRAASGKITVMPNYFWIGVTNEAHCWRFHPVESMLAAIAQIGRAEWKRRVKAVQGRLL